MNGRTKLTEAEIKEAKEIWIKENSRTIAISKLARKFRVAYGTMWAVLNDTDWVSKRDVQLYCNACNSSHRSTADKNWKHSILRI